MRTSSLTLQPDSPCGKTLVTCIASRYTQLVVVSFRHKGLQALYERDSLKGVQVAHAPKLRRIFSALDVAQGPRDLGFPGFQSHPLSGRLADYQDYH